MQRQELTLQIPGAFDVLIILTDSIDLAVQSLISFCLSSISFFLASRDVNRTLYPSKRTE